MSDDRYGDRVDRMKWQLHSRIEKATEDLWEEIYELRRRLNEKADRDA